MMKKITISFFLLLAMLMANSLELKADVFENFDGLSEGSYGNYSYNGFYIFNGLCSSTNALTGNAVRLRNAYSYLDYEGIDGNGKDGGVGSISFWYRSWDGSPAAVYDVQVNIDGAGWTTIGTQINNTSTAYAEWTYLLNNTSDNILIRIEWVSGERLHVDDFSITDYTGGGNAPPIISNIVQTPSSGITSSTTVSVAADVTDSDGTVGFVDLFWGTTSGVLGNTIAMSNGGSGDTYTTATDIPAQLNGTTVYYAVYAEDDDMVGSSSAEMSYDVIDPATTTLPYGQTFNSDLGDCYPYSVAGPSNNWIWDDMGGPNGHAYMNGYGGSNPEEDWLILPGIDFEAQANEIMQFYTFYEYGSEDANNYLKLFYSDDYAGVGDPSSATWDELDFIQASAWAQWQPSFIVDLSSVSGSNVYIGFKYYSTDDPRSWRVDDISIFSGSMVDVTFQVNMEEVLPVSTNGVHLAGSFDTSWDPAGIELTDPDMDDIYTVTLPLYTGIEYQFKYVNGDAWGSDEGVPVECQAPGTTNRFEVVGGVDYSIDPVCFASCVDCGILYDYDVTFQVDMKNEIVGGGVNIAGSFNGWGNTAMTNVSGTIWEVTIPLQETTYQEYKFKNGETWEENFSGPCLNGGNNRFITVPSETTTVDLVCFKSCELCPVADFVMINEVDSDTPSSDNLEFIELYDGGDGNTDLSGLVVVLYNGGVTDDASYNAIDLDGFFTNVDGYFLIGSPGMGADIDMGTGWLQNGADGVAIHIGNASDYPNGTPVSDVNLIDALVYDTSDGDDSALLDVLTPGQPQINENGRGDKDFDSNQRIPNGSGGMRMTMTYDQSPSTPGVENIGFYTHWTGDFDNDWSNAGNWHNGVPNDMLNAEIPDVSNAKAPYPIISGSATVGSLFMAIGSTLEIASSGDLTVLGTFTNNGTLNIKSDASGTGSLIESNGVMATMEQHISADAWHLVSSPVVGAQSSVYTGLYLYEWDEPNGDFVEITSLTYGLGVTNGFYTWSESSISSPTDVAFTGNLNAGDKNPTLTYTLGSGYAQDGWNLNGNPYPSGLTWDNTWSQVSLDPTVYVRDDAASGQFLRYNYTPGAIGNTLPNGEIPPTQGFYVKANAASPSMTIPDNKRVHTSNNFYKSNPVKGDVFEISIASKENDYIDRIFIGVNGSATYNFDSEYDAYKLKGVAAAPQLFTIDADGNELSVNMIPSVESNYSLPLNLEVGVEAMYVISLSNISGFDGIPLYLEDKLHNKVVDIKSNVNYKFFGSPNDMNDRFLLHFSYAEAPANGGSQSSDDIMVYSSNKVISVLSNEEFSGLVTVYNLLGQEVVSEKLNQVVNYDIEMADKNGYFIVNIVSDRGVVNKKIYLSK